MKRISYQRISSAIIGSFKKYPILLIVSFLQTAIILKYIDIDYQDYASKSLYLKIMLCGFISLPLVYSAGYWQRVSGKIQWISWLLVMVLTGLAAWQIWEIPKNAEILAYYFAGWIVTGILIALAAPIRYWKGESAYWVYLKNLITSVVLAGLYALVLCIALSLARAALVNLFQIENPGFTYEDVAIVCLVALFVLLFVAIVPDQKVEDETGPAPAFIKPVVVFVFLPLSVLYVGILYAYGVRMLLLGEWPRGWVTYLVFSAAVLTIVTYIICHPLKDERQTFVRLTRQWLFPALLPLTIIQLMSIGMRISQHGLTFNRVVVLSIGIWLLLTTAYQVFIRRKTLIWFPLSFLAFTLWVLFSPWSAFDLDKNHRKDNIREVLQSLEPPVERLPEKSVIIKVKNEQLTEISTAFYDALSLHGLSVIEEFVPDSCYNLMQEKEQTDRNSSAHTTMQYIGQCTAIDFGMGNPVETADFDNRFTMNASHQISEFAIDVKGYNSLVQFQSNNIRNRTNGMKVYADSSRRTALSFMLDNNQLIVKRDNLPWAEISLEELSAKMSRDAVDKYTLEMNLQIWTGKTIDGQPVKIIISFLEGSFREGKAEIDFLNGYFMY
ncbi:MAG: DUF4153 domain-containing protein [Saprospiraceae bacterium]|nr:DUF4153 domain-containing protein [Saprospiraceae bacterium]